MYEDVKNKGPGMEPCGRPDVIFLYTLENF